MVIKMKEVNRDILYIKVKYNQKKLILIADEELSLIENKIYGNKTEVEKIVLEFECIIEHLKKTGNSRIEVFEQILKSIKEMPSLSSDIIEALKKLISIVEIDLNMNYGFFNAVKYSDTDTIEKVKNMNLR